MSMSKKTSKMLRGSVSGSFVPGAIIRGYNLGGSHAGHKANVLSYWKSKGWIKLNGQFYVLTKKGYNEA